MFVTLLWVYKKHHAINFINDLFTYEEVQVQYAQA